MLKSITQNFVSCLIFLLVITGCSSIKSVVDPQFNGKITRVFIQTVSSDSVSYFSKEFMDGLVKGFDQYGIDCKVGEWNSLSLDDPFDIKTKMQNFNADAGMIILQTKENFTRGTITGGEYELSMLCPSSDKPIWRGILSLGSGSGNNTYAQRIIYKLEEDKIITKLTKSPSNNAERSIITDR